MSYDLDLVDPVTGHVIELDTPHQMRGGTYAIGGTRYAGLNITYNYAKILYNVLGDDGIRTIYDKSGVDSIPILQAAIDKLGNDINPDYWEATEGNVKLALIHLLTLAKMAPHGIWKGD